MMDFQRLAMRCPDPSRPGIAGPPDAVFTDAQRETAILIVEDEAMIAWMLESLFEDMGFTTITIAATGEDAIAAAARRTPGLIVSDINLGAGIDGVAAAAAIRATGRVAVVFVSGYADADVRARIEHRVADAAVLRKPIQPGELRRAVFDALRDDSVH